MENHSTMKTLQLNFWEKCSSNTASKEFLNEDNVSDGVPNGIYAVFVCWGSMKYPDFHINFLMGILMRKLLNYK